MMNGGKPWKRNMSQNLRKNWHLVELLEGKQPIGSNWLYKLKFKADGTIEKYKARLVEKGYS